MTERRSGFIEILRSAQEAVEAAGLNVDSPAGTAAFKSLVVHMLEASERSTAGAEMPVGNVPGGSGGERKLATWARLAPEALREIFRFGPESLELVISSSLLPGSMAGKQRLLALLKLAGERVGYDKESVRSEEINSLCDDYACRDSNITSNLRGYSNFIQIGRQEGALVYKVTRPGVERAREVIGELMDASR